MAASEVDELRRLLKVCAYERQGLQRRLDAVRKAKDDIVRLLDSPTLQEHLDRGGDVFDFIGGKVRSAGPKPLKTGDI